MKQTVTEISGRGVGLDAVRAIVRDVRGAIRVWTDLGGSAFKNNCLDTLHRRERCWLSRNEPYAFPLAHIDRALKVAKKDIEVTAGRQHFRFENRQIGLVRANRIGGTEEISLAS